MEKICVVCGNLFQAKTNRAKYCSRKCANHSRYNRTFEQIRQENEKLKQTVLSLYDLGWKDPRIAKQVGKSSKWVWNIRKELNLPVKETERQRKNKRLAEWREAFKDERRICKRCEAEFSPTRVHQLFCCRECERKHNHQVNDIKRKRLEENKRVDDISLNDVFKKYKGICYLCGGECDLHAVRVVNGVPHPLGDYPSREHVIPLSKGGTHSWDNIRLAHIRCNSSKGVSCL